MTVEEKKTALWNVLKHFSQVAGIGISKSKGGEDILKVMLTEEMASFADSFNGTPILTEVSGEIKMQ